MRKLVRLYHRKPIEGVYCAYCDMKRDGIVLFEDMYVKKMLSCGHKVGRSFRLPPHEMIRMGLMNKDMGRDPRAIAAAATIIEDARRMWLERKKQRWVEENMAGGKQWM